MEICLAKVQGFCSGVSKAIRIVEKALADYGAPLYVYHDIVHNNTVIKSLHDKGVVFVEEISMIPISSTVVFSAHGVSPYVVSEARKRKLDIIDATCPLVKNIHLKAQELSKAGNQIILIGHKKHQEIIGTAGYIDPRLIHYVQEISDVAKLQIDENMPLAYLTQTTLSVSDTAEIIEKIKEFFPNVSIPKNKDICFATQERQKAVKDLAKTCDVIIICGSSHSSNSNRLKEVALSYGVDTYLIDSGAELDLDWLKGKRKLGISSGASVPGSIVERLIDRIRAEFDLS